MLPQLLYRGSVKDLHGSPADETLVFAFSDRYSVFDWGEMPDAIGNKGKALAAITFGLFRHLSSKGIEHHCLGLVDRDMVPLLNPSPSRFLKVKQVQVLRPIRHANTWDYSLYQQRPSACLVPLEVIFRFGLPRGSSLLRRLQENPAYAAELKLPAEIKEGSVFAAPLIEYSSKLEESDRILTRQEAQQLAGMSDKEFTLLASLAQKISLHLHEFFASFDVELWDGKLEFAFTATTLGSRSFTLVDAIGPDELRLIYRGIPLSKELIRQFYLHTPWYQAIKQAQTLAKEKKSTAWRELCRLQLGALPAPLSDQQIQVVSGIYQNIADFTLEACGLRPWFTDKLAFKQVCTLAENFNALS